MPSPVRWAAVAAVLCAPVLTAAHAAAPARPDGGPQTLVNCSAWDRHGANIGDNLFFPDRAAPRQTEVMPIGGTELDCVNLPSSPDAVRLTAGPHTSIGRPVVLAPGMSRRVHPVLDAPDADTVLTVALVPAGRLSPARR